MLGVRSVDTLWIVVEAYKSIFRRDRNHAAQVVNDLLGTGMYLPSPQGRACSHGRMGVALERSLTTINSARNHASHMSRC